MKIAKRLGKLVVIVGAVVLLAGVAGATLAGVVTAVGKHDITVSGAVYPLEEGISYQDMTGHSISFAEIRPGVAVELDFDDEGRLSVIRASVVR